MLSGSCYQESSGFDVGGVGEAVGGSPQDLEQVVSAFDASVAGSVCGARRVFRRMRR